MNDFSVEFREERSYKERVIVEVKLECTPPSEDYQKILDAVDTLKQISAMYIKMEQE